MEKFSYQDIEDYYDQTEVHYRTWWKLEKSLGLHYGVWDKDTKTTADAIINLNKVLMELGEIKEGMYGEFTLDALKVMFRFLKMVVKKFQVLQKVLPVSIR